MIRLRFRQGGVLANIACWLGYHGYYPWYCNEGCVNSRHFCCQNCHAEICVK